MNSNSKTYDGTALTLPTELSGQVTVDGLLETQNHKLGSISFTYANADNSPENNGRLNAGIATVTPSNAVIMDASNQPVDANYYKVRYISGTLEVTKINVTIRVEPDRWTGAQYNGTLYKTGFTNPNKGVEDYVMMNTTILMIAAKNSFSIPTCSRSKPMSCLTPSRRRPRPRRLRMRFPAHPSIIRKRRRSP